jgi:hypothetical protein
MLALSRASTMEVHNFQMTSRRPIPRTPPELFGTKTKIPHAIRSGISPVEKTV